MKNIIQYSFIFLGMILGALFLTYCWFHYPNYFIVFPENFMLWLVNISGSSNDEELTDIMLAIIFSISFLVSSIVIFFLIKIVQKIKK